MKKNTLVVVLLAVVVVLMSVAVVLQSRAIRNLKEQVAEAEAAQKTIVTPPAVPAPVEETPAPAFKTAESMAVPAPVPPAVPSNGSTNNPMAGLADMMKSPQMKEMVRAQQKIVIDGMYGSLSKYLNLSTNEMDSLKELLLERQMALVDTGMAAMGGSGADLKQVAADAKSVKDDYAKKIQDLLGAQDYPAFQDYEKTAPDRMSVQMFKSSLTADAPLTDQQEESPVTAMAEERKALPSNSLMNSQTPDPSAFTEEGIAEAVKQMGELQQRDAGRAAAILTPSQLDQFTKFQQQMNNMAATSMKMAAQLFGNKNSAPAAAGSPAP